MKRSELKRKTPLKSTSTLKRSPMPTARTGLARNRAPKAKKREPNGFPEPVRMAVRRRSGGRCEAQLRVCTGKLEHIHHRKLRRHRDHSEANAIGCCSACHAHIHANPGKAYLMGLLVHEWLDPADVPVKRGSAA